MIGFPMAGFDNRPATANMPVLKYKYVMNEPFVNGTSAET